LIMQQIVKDGDYVRFAGFLENEDDYRVASEIAVDCSLYSVDDDDEDYCEGVRTCFNCRYRRWLADGFQCMKGCLRV
jgi:hypothetical protein